MRIGLRALVILLVLLFPAIGRCGVWDHKGSTWTHPNGISVTFPGDFQVTEDATAHLNALAQGGYVNMVLTPVLGEAQMKEAMKGIQQTMQMNQVTFKKDTMSGTQNGLNVAFQEGSSVTPHGVPLYVKLGIFSRKDKESYLLLQLIVPEKVLAKNQPIIKKVLDSVK